MSRLTPELVHQAVINASRKHMCKNEVIEFLQDKENEYSVYRQLLKGESIDVEYRYKEVVSVNGKKRIVAISSFRSRVIMHTLMLLIKKEYAARLSDDCYNCIKGRGINASRKRYDPVRQIKRIIGRYRRGDICSWISANAMNRLARRSCSPVTKRSGRISEYCAICKEFLSVI